MPLPERLGDQLRRPDPVPGQARHTELLAFNTSDLSSAGVYPTGPYPRAVDLSPSGNQVVGGIDQDHANVQEFNLGNGMPSSTAEHERRHRPATPPGGVRFSEDGSRIFSITTTVAASSSCTSSVPSPCRRP